MIIFKKLQQVKEIITQLVVCFNVIKIALDFSWGAVKVF